MPNSGAKRLNQQTAGIQRSPAGRRDLKMWVMELQKEMGEVWGTGESDKSKEFKRRPQIELRRALWRKQQQQQHQWWWW
jgi:hypothetical protein